MGRVHQGKGPGNHSRTLTKPVPPRRVVGYPWGFPNTDFFRTRTYMNLLPLLRLVVGTVQYQKKIYKTEYSSYLLVIQYIHPKMSSSSISSIPTRCYVEFVLEHSPSVSVCSRPFSTLLSHSFLLSYPSPSLLVPSVSVLCFRHLRLILFSLPH